MARQHLLRPRRSWAIAAAAVVAATFLPLAVGGPQPSVGATNKWLSSARVSPRRVPAGDTVAISASLTSPRSRAVLIDLEVHDADGRMVARRMWDRQTFARGQTREYQWNWTVPSTEDPGRYEAKIVVVGLGWNVQ